MRGPHDIFQFIVRDLASVTHISDAAILYDDTFGEITVITLIYSPIAHSHDPSLQKSSPQYAREASDQKVG